MTDKHHYRNVAGLERQAGRVEELVARIGLARTRHEVESLEDELATVAMEMLRCLSYAPTDPGDKAIPPGDVEWDCTEIS